MPELPEVETVRKVLETWLIGRKVIGVRVFYPPLFKNVTEKDLNQQLIGQKFEVIDRHGKYLILKTNDFAIISHLRMEGKYYLGHYKGSHLSKQGKEYDPAALDGFSKHVHALFELDNGSILMYHDVRKFGKMALHPKATYLADQSLSRVGKEPFQMKNVDNLFVKLQKRTTSIKSVLLNQSLIAGLGNIYVDETLFLSNMDPREACYHISHKELDSIVTNAKKVLKRAIEQGGTTVHSFHTGNFVDGKFQDELNVYGREGQPCHVCGTAIVKMKVAQRGTHFCPQCQRKKTENTVRVLGITGVIGSGKTTVSKLFQTYGLIVLDADQYARSALDKGSKAYSAVVARYGDSILDKQQQIDRSLLRQKVADKQSELKFLESVIHPYVIAETKKEIAKKEGIYLMDVPLLFEARMNELCDATLYVHTQEKIRKQRLIQRGTMPLKAAEDLRKNTWTSNQKMLSADFIIDNSSSLEVTRNQVTALQNYLWNR